MVDSGVTLAFFAKLQSAAKAAASIHRSPAQQKDHVARL